MKKSIGLIALLLIFCLNITALAAEPVSSYRVNEDGRELIIKTFEITPDADPQELIEPEFTEKGFTFAYLEIKTDEVTSHHSKEISVTRDAESGSNKNSDIISKFEPYIDQDEDGMVGRLHLDTGSFDTKVKGYTTQSYTVSATREYGGFAYSDPSGIPQTTEKDGMTLHITGVSWIVTGTELVGDSLLPNQYKAVVSYGATASKSVVTGYITTAAYRGVIEKTVVDKIIVTITYEGTAIPVDYTWIWIVLAALAGLLLLCGIGVVIFLLRARDVEIYNKHGDDYERIGHEWIDFKNPVVNLLPHKRNAYTGDYLLVLSKKAALALMDKELNVRLENQTICRKVENDKIYIMEGNEE